MKLDPSRPLPLLRSLAEAKALAEKEKDPFCLVAFRIQRWLGSLLARTAAEYAEKKNPKDRSLQSGEAWRAFLQHFGPPAKPRFNYLLLSLLRFTAAYNSPTNSLRHALGGLAAEHTRSGDYFLPQSRPPRLPTADDELARRTLLRWCDWLDAAIHLRVHRFWHRSPLCFDPDPETRLLAGLGDAQRHLAHLHDHAKTAWLSDFLAAAQHYKHSPKWSAVGKAMSADSDRLWLYPDVDSLVISFWPLVKAYNWTYRDLLHAIRPALKRPNAYPCDREQDFATYCANVLGLRKSAKGVSARNGRPAGYEIAQDLCPALKINTHTQNPHASNPHQADKKDLRS